MSPAIPPDTSKADRHDGGPRRRAKKPTRGGTKGVPRAEREEQLLDIGERVFAERGYDAVSMEEVAAEAGVTKPMIYTYFGSKEEFFVAGVHRAYERIATRVEEAAAVGGTGPEMLTRVTDAVFAWVDESRRVWPLVYGVRVPGGRVAEEAARDRAAMVALIGRLIREAVDVPRAEDEIEPLAEATVATVMALADRWLRHPEEPRELQTLRVVRIIGPAVLALAETD